MKKYSKRTSISDEAIKELSNLYTRLFHALINLDNKSIIPDSRKTLKKEDIQNALQKFNEYYSLVELVDIEEMKDEEKNIHTGRLLVDNEEIDLNVNLTIDLENGNIEKK